MITSARFLKKKLLDTRKTKIKCCESGYEGQSLQYSYYSIL